MRIIGLHDGHNANAALVEDGRVVAAVEEERFSRIKNHDARVPGNSGPIESLRYCLEHAGDEVDAIAIPLESPNDISFRSYASFVRDATIHPERQERWAFLTQEDRRIYAKYGLDEGDYHNLPGAVQKSRIRKIRMTLLEAGLGSKPLVHLNHHMAHHASAYFCSGLESAVSFSLDGRGDDLAGMVCLCREGRIDVLGEINCTDSIGHFYSAITVVLGFTAVKHEGKITGLAAYAPADDELTRRFRELFPPASDGGMRSRLADHLRLGPYPHALFGAYIEKVRHLCQGYPREVVAASAQKVLEDVVTEWAAFWRERTGMKSVLLSGGVFANVKLNQRIMDIPGVETVYVHPGMTDAGLGVGAALHAYHVQRRQMGLPFERTSLNQLYLGPHYGEGDLRKALDQSGLEYTRPDQIHHVAADALIAKRIVARYDGAMEYGPRALGNRTILYSTQDPSVNDWLNKQLRRTEFMPFAPVTLASEASRCYEVPGDKNPWFTARFMTITLNCTAFMRERSPAVVHVDNTARPQVVEEEDNAGYYDILSEYYKRTGIPSLVNTSFNVHEEPIVCSPDEAIKAFVQSNLHHMIMGPFWVNGSQGEHSR